MILYLDTSALVKLFVEDAAESAFEAFRGQMPFHFAVFDDRLMDAAKQAGIPLLDA
jgi:hypothetical protein